MSDDPRYENWEESERFETKSVMTGYAGRKSYEKLKVYAESLGMVETLHKETKRGLVHFTFRDPKDLKTR